MWFISILHLWILPLEVITKSLVCIQISTEHTTLWISRVPTQCQDAHAWRQPSAQCPHFACTLSLPPIYTCGIEDISHTPTDHFVSTLMWSTFAIKLTTSYVYLRKLKGLKGSQSFNIGKIRNFLTANSCARFTFLSNKSQNILEAIQWSATGYSCLT